MNIHELDRRQALFGGLSAVAATALFSSRAQAAVRLTASSVFQTPSTPRTLVLVQLTGGNDGLSTIVPFGDDRYGASRRELRVAGKDVLKLDKYHGFHPELKQLRALYDAGTLALVEGAGYPHPIRSHFKSYEIWHTADERGRAAGEGWIGRLCNSAWTDNRDPNLVVHIGANTPYSLYSQTHPAASFATPTGYRWAGDAKEKEAYEKSAEICEHEPAPAVADSGKSLDYLRQILRDGQASSEEIRRAAARYRTKTEYPDDVFAAALHDVAALATGQVGSRVFSVELGGFDTHSDQRNRHDALMRRLDAGLGTFMKDVQGTEAGKNMLIVVYSEFGRRVHENGSRGTDHGVAGPMFVLGPSIHGGLYGKHPSLDDLDDGDLKHTIDFRSVYATVIEKWFGIEQQRVLDAKYPFVALV